METSQIVALLQAERDRLNRAIELLQGPTKRRGRPPVNKTAFDYNAPDVPEWVKPASAKGTAPKAKATAPKKRTMSAAGRKAIGDAARKRWAAIRAAKGKKG